MRFKNNSFMLPVGPLALAAGLLLAAGTAQAANNTFNASSSNDYNTAGNWSAGHVPITGETAITGGKNATLFEHRHRHGAGLVVRCPIRRRYRRF